MYIILETFDLFHIIAVWDENGETKIWNDPIEAKEWGNNNLKEPIIVKIN